MRLFHYFAATHRPELGASTPRIGSSPHTDWHMLTVILQDDQGGLQVLSRSDGWLSRGGSWIDVPARDGELVRVPQLGPAKPGPNPNLNPNPIF